MTCGIKASNSEKSVKGLKSHWSFTIEKIAQNIAEQFQHCPFVLWSQLSVRSLLVWFSVPYIYCLCYCNKLYWAAICHMQLRVKPLWNIHKIGIAKLLLIIFLCTCSFIFSAIRELTSQALHNLTYKAPEYMAKTGEYNQIGAWGSQPATWRNQGKIFYFFSRLGKFWDFDKNRTTSGNVTHKIYPFYCYVSNTCCALKSCYNNNNYNGDNISHGISEIP